LAVRLRDRRDSPSKGASTYEIGRVVPFLGNQIGRFFILAREEQGMTELTPTDAVSPLGRETARVSALFHGHIIASSTDVIVVFAPGEPPVRYFPQADVGMSSLRAVDKVEDELGEATRYSVYRDGELIENAAWSYELPHTDYSDLAGRIAFRDGLVKYEVEQLGLDEASQVIGEKRPWDANLQPSQRDGSVATNSPDLAARDGGGSPIGSAGMSHDGMEYDG
jgi:uncharacterized protein (DUF427 family)